MKIKTTIIIWIFLSAFGWQCSSQPVKNTYPYATFKPVCHDETTIDGGFLGDIRKRSRDIGIPTLLEQFEKYGYIGNFRVCAAQSDQVHVGYSNSDEFVHKLLEAMAWYSTESQVDAMLFQQTEQTILSAQQNDGYLNTYYENPLIKEEGKLRFQPTNRFEFYDFGHFTQAAIARYYRTGDRTLLDAAIKFADLIVKKFAAPNHLPYKLYRGRVNLKYEHPNHELALVELYRATGDRRYLDFVTQTYREYGYFSGEHFNEMWGHAVQENLLEAGAANLYLETGDKRLLDNVSRLWDDMHDRKMYIIGGTGSRLEGESYGKPYELPNATSYCETCAAIALTFWNDKMLLATGQGRYADEMDRTLYNNVLAGYGLNGYTYFYQNPMEWDPANPQNMSRNKGRRLEMYRTPCCPPNLHRLFASLDQYVYTYDDAGVQVNLFVNSTLKHTLADGHTLKMTQKTGYPWSGKVLLTMEVDDPQARGTLRVRIPEWCVDPQLTIEGQSYPVKPVDGYLVLNQPWGKGKTLELSLPITARVIQGNPRVKDQVGRIAIQRGPLVYCMEGADNPGLDLNTISFSERPTITEKFEPYLLGGIVRLTVAATQVESNGEEKAVQVKLVPYYAWANREPGQMKVWLPARDQ